MAGKGRKLDDDIQRYQEELAAALEWLREKYFKTEVKMLEALSTRMGRTISSSMYYNWTKRDTGAPLSKELVAAVRDILDSMKDTPGQIYKESQRQAHFDTICKIWEIRYKENTNTTPSIVAIAWDDNSGLYVTGVDKDSPQLSEKVVAYRDSSIPRHLEFYAPKVRPFLKITAKLPDKKKGKLELQIEAMGDTVAVAVTVNGGEPDIFELSQDTREVMSLAPGSAFTINASCKKPDIPKISLNFVFFGKT